MLDEAKAQAVVDAVKAAWSGEQAHPSAEDIETLLRPFAPIHVDTHQRIESLMRQERIPVGVRVNMGPWFEAHDVTEGEGAHAVRRIEFLLMDTCTCVLDHLPKAIEEAEKRGRNVDPRVKALLQHEYLRTKR